MTMKKLLLFTVLTLGVTYLGFGQEAGVKAGLNFANVKVDNGADPDGKVGFHFGGYYKTPLEGAWSLQPEVLFSFQGWEDQNITYLNIPVLAVYNVNDELSFHAGPQFGILLGGDNEATDFLNTLDVTIAFGGEYMITEELSGGVRYNLGVTNIADSDLSSDVFNRVFQLYAAYRLKY